MDSRPHIGGNCYTYEYEDTGISLHAYGSHIFHCSDQDTWNYINRFTDFNQHQHRVLTTHRGKVYSMPINLGTINSFFGTNLRPDEVAGFLEGQRIVKGKPANLEEQAISLIGRPLYEAFIRGYTTKQWGCDPRELPASIITRLPVRTHITTPTSTTGIREFRWRVTLHLPADVKGIPVELGVDFFDDREVWEKKARKLSIPVH